VSDTLILTGSCSFDILQQIGHAPCPSCDVGRVVTATSSPNLRSEGGVSNPTKSTALIEAEHKIKHYKMLLRIAADKLEEAVRRANEAASRATSAESSATDALVKTSVAESSQHRSEGEHLQAIQELERQRRVTEETEMDLRRAQQNVRGLESENQMLRRTIERVKESKGRYAKAYRELEAQQAEEKGRQVVDMKRSFEAGRSEGRKYGYEEGRREGYRRGRREGGRIGKEEGRYEAREEALAAFDRYLDKEIL